MNRTIAWVNKTEGRDKLCKAIQYAARIIKYNASLAGNKDLELRFTGLFNGMRDARKLFRLLKSIIELQKILELLNNSKLDEVNRVFNLIIRFWFMLYWGFDNVGMLSAIKFMNYDTKSVNKKAGACWLLGLAFTLIFKLYELYQLQVKVSKSSEQKSKASQKYTAIGLDIIKTIGDMAPAGMASGFLPQTLGINLSDGVVGMGGLISAVITSYQLYD